MKTNEKGITIISLAITVIVLLILSGVSVVLITKDNGIIKKAEASEDKVYKRELHDSIENELINLTNSSDLQVTKTEIDIVVANFGSVTHEGNKTFVEDKNTKVEVTDLYERYGDDLIAITPKDPDNNYENDFDQGRNPIVYIYDIPKAGDERIPEGSTILNENPLVIADKNLNEWVWIPVSTNAFNKSIKITDYARIEQTLVRYVYRFHKGRYGDFDKNHFEIPKEEYSLYKKNMLASIFKNHGFFMGRYETGSKTLRNQQNSLVYSEPVLTQGAYPYNYVIINQAFHVSKKLAENLPNRASMVIFGIQWDLYLNYLATLDSTINFTKSGEEYGNLMNSQFTANPGKYYMLRTRTWTDVPNNYIKSAGTQQLFTLGSSEAHKFAEVYDTVGNLEEFTLENRRMTPIRVQYITRGGQYAYITFGNTQSFVTRAEGMQDSTASAYGFRCTLVDKVLSEIN